MGHLFLPLFTACCQLILGVDNVQYATSVGMAIAIILLDYIIAYTVIGLSSMFGSSRPAIIGGVVVTLGLRFLCHFLTGWMIWDALWPNEFGMTSAVYSLWYNGSYMLPEIVITAILACILVPWAEQSLPRQEITLRLIQGRPAAAPPKGAPHPPGRAGARCRKHRAAGRSFAPCRGWRRAILRICGG